MDIKKMTKERLISDHESRFIGGGKCWVTRDELLRRLGEGEKTIKLISKIWDVIGDIEDDKPNFANKFNHLLPYMRCYRRYRR